MTLAICAPLLLVLSCDLWFQFSINMWVVELWNGNCMRLFSFHPFSD